MLGEGLTRGTTTPEVLQEFVHVRARRRSRSDAVDLARGYAILLAPLLEVTALDLDKGLDLFARTAQLGAFDAVLAATAERAGATAIVSADTGFASLQELIAINPAQEDFIDVVLQH